MQLLYGDNLGGERHQTTYGQLAEVLLLEERLKKWRDGLPPCMDLTKVSSSATDGAFRLATILRLRYLNVRSLIHRSVISGVMRSVSSTDRNASSSPSLDLARTASLETYVISSLETIDIIHNTTDSTSARPKALGAWWFSLYYSKIVSFT